MQQDSKTQTDGELLDLLRGSKIVVLRLNHRPRDQRVTTHVCLTARAFGADGVIIADTTAEEIVDKIHKLNLEWGNGFWVRDAFPAHQTIGLWRSLGGIVINLSMYGEDLRNLLSELYHAHYNASKPFLVIVGASKVPSEIYSMADYNVSVTDQPHSEVAALAVFLDRLSGGRWPKHHGRIKINPRLKAKGSISIDGGRAPLEEA